MIAKRKTNKALAAERRVAVFDAYQRLYRTRTRFLSKDVAEEAGVSLALAIDQRRQLLQKGHIDAEKWVAGPYLQGELDWAMELLPKALRQRKVQPTAFIAEQMDSAVEQVNSLRTYLLKIGRISKNDWPARIPLERPDSGEFVVEDSGYRPSLAEIADGCAAIRAKHLATGEAPRLGAAVRMPKVARVYCDGRNRALRGMAD